ncbi:MAG: right-handed parallel beta-helix repeat-containing protein, partial [Gammaproteobacteria bacterium]
MSRPSATASSNNKFINNLATKNGGSGFSIQPRTDRNLFQRNIATRNRGFGFDDGSIG